MSKPETNDDNEILEEEEMPVNLGGQGPLLKHVETSSGEENYNEVLKIKSKIWRFDEGENKWKERGHGDAKILRHKETGKCMFIFRREAIGKLAAQHGLIRGMRISSNPNDDKSVIWLAPKDFTDDPVGYPEKFFLKFTTKEQAAEFKAAFESITA